MSDRAPFAVVQGKEDDCYVVINGRVFVFQHIARDKANGIAHVLNHWHGEICCARERAANEKATAAERARCAAIVRAHENTEPARAFDAIVEAIESGK